MTKLLSVAELWELDRRVQKAVDLEMEKLLTIEDMEQRQLKAQHGLFGRLVAASHWLTMMQACVKTHQPVIQLTDEVATTLYDARIAVPVL